MSYYRASDDDTAFGLSRKWFGEEEEEETEEKSQPKFCPFRKKVWFVDTLGFHQPLKLAEGLKEEFQPCLQDSCALWDRKKKRCSYLGGKI